MGRIALMKTKLVDIVLEVAKMAPSYHRVVVQAGKNTST